MLDLAVLLLERKRFIVRFVLAAAVLAVVVALILPVRYEAKIVLLPPAQNTSISSTLLGQMGNMGSLGSLASLAGGSLGLKNPADMYVSFLTSRTVEDAVIQRFHLMSEYHAKRMSDARKELERRTTVVAGNKDGLIRISLDDHDPKRAAELANGYVDEFRKLSASLAITEAARRRLFFEQQLQDTKDKLTQAENAMTKTEQSTGVLQIDSQARSLIESAAVLRAQVVAKQVQIEGMRAFATEDNPEPDSGETAIGGFAVTARTSGWIAAGSGFGHQSFERKSDAGGNGISPAISRSQISGNRLRVVSERTRNRQAR